MRSLPSPIGKATQRVWGHKYSIYRPVFVDTAPVYHYKTPYMQQLHRLAQTPYITKDDMTPVYQTPYITKYDYGYYTLNPRRNRHNRHFYPLYKPF